MGIRLRDNIEEKFHPDSATDIAMNNLLSLYEILASEKSGMEHAPKKPDGSYGNGDLETPTWYKYGSAEGVSGITLVIQSLERVYPLLDNELEIRGKVKEMLRALSHLGFTSGG